MFWSLLLSPAHAADTAPDVSFALTEAKKPSWEPKGKALEPLGRADTKVKAESFADALPLLRESLEAQPGCGKCLEILGNALIGLRQYDAALQVGDRLTTLFPDRKESVFVKLWALSDAHRGEELLPVIERYLELDKGDLAVWYERNHQLGLLGREAEALAKLEGAKAAGIGEGDVACMKTEAQLLSGDLAAARESFKACDVTESWLAMRRNTEGWLLVAEGDLQGAQGKFSTGGADLESRATLAWVRVKEGKHDQALNLARKLQEEAPWALDAHLLAVQALVGLGRRDEAEAELKKVLLADGWKEKHKSAGRDRTILAARGKSWPQEIGREALVAGIALRVAAGDAAGAKALRDAAVEVHGSNPAFDQALQPGPAPAPAP